MHVKIRSNQHQSICLPLKLLFFLKSLSPSLCVNVFFSCWPCRSLGFHAIPAMHAGRRLWKSLYHQAHDLSPKQGDLFLTRNVQQSVFVQVQGPKTCFASLKHDSCLQILCLWSGGVVQFIVKHVFTLLHVTRWHSVLFDSCGPTGNADCVGGFDDTTSLSQSLNCRRVVSSKSQTSGLWALCQSFKS